ncbi:MAG: ArdC family protein [Hyphomicrobium sp.]|jgi:antirestriction protein ArdC
MTRRPDTKPRDIHAEITHRLIELIEANPGMPQMPWRKSSNPLWMPQNALTSRYYSGINVLSLWIAAETRGFTSPIYATYRQWQDKGCQVRRGERAELVVFYKLCGRPHNL